MLPIIPHHYHHMQAQVPYPPLITDARTTALALAAAAKVVGSGNVRELSAPYM